MKGKKIMTIGVAVIVALNKGVANGLKISLILTRVMVVRDVREV